MTMLGPFYIYYVQIFGCLILEVPLIKKII